MEGRMGWARVGPQNQLPPRGGSWINFDTLVLELN